MITKMDIVTYTPRSREKFFVFHGRRITILLLLQDRDAQACNPLIAPPSKLDL